MVAERIHHIVGVVEAEVVAAVGVIGLREEFAFCREAIDDASRFEVVASEGCVAAHNEDALVIHRYHARCDADARCRCRGELPECGCGGALQGAAAVGPAIHFVAVCHCGIEHEVAGSDIAGYGAVVDARAFGGVDACSAGGAAVLKVHEREDEGVVRGVDGEVGHAHISFAVGDYVVHRHVACVHVLIEGDCADIFAREEVIFAQEGGGG